MKNSIKMDLYIVRPANIYGPYANFNPVNSMVVSSLIKRVCDRENPLRIWGNGNMIRDFIFGGYANGMINVVLKNKRSYKFRKWHWIYNQKIN